MKQNTKKIVLGLVLICTLTITSALGVFGYAKIFQSKNQETEMLETIISDDQMKALKSSKIKYRETITDKDGTVHESDWANKTTQYDVIED